jgi:hypothetical protein
MPALTEGGVSAPGALGLFCGHLFQPLKNSVIIEGCADDGAVGLSVKLVKKTFSQNLQSSQKLCHNSRLR